MGRARLPGLPARRGRRYCAAAAVVAASLFMGLGVPFAGTASADTLPYPELSSLPSAVSSPPVDPAAPFTPTVLSLIHQLEPDSPPTLAELQNAALLLHGTTGSADQHSLHRDRAERCTNRNDAGHLTALLG